MSMIDEKIEFSAAQDLAGVTNAGVASENVIDLGLETNNLGRNVHGAGYFNFQVVQDDVDPATLTLTVKLQDSANGAAWADVSGTTTSVANVAKGFKGVVRLPDGIKRFVRAYYTPSATITSAKIDAYIGQPMAQH